MKPRFEKWRTCLHLARLRARRLRLGRSPEAAASKPVVLVKLGEIGDYILFRNFLPEVRRTIASGRPLILIGNEAWKDLALSLDAEHVDEFVWVKSTRIGWWQVDRQVYEAAARIRAALVVNAAYTRSPLSDLLCMLIDARIKYCLADIMRPEGWRDRLRRHIYNRKIDVHSARFEFDRHKHLFAELTGAWSELRRPSITLPSTIQSVRQFTQRPSVICCAGSSDASKRWPMERFMEVVGRLADIGRWNVLLVGNEEDRLAYDEALAHMEGRTLLRNLAGRTSMTDLLALLKDAVLVIANDTGIVHMADAMGIPSVCILGGGHPGRFIPYPTASGSQIHTVMEKLPCFNCDWNCRHAAYDGTTYPCIEQVSADTVAREVDRLLDIRIAMPSRRKDMRTA